VAPPSDGRSRVFFRVWLNGAPPFLPFAMQPSSPFFFLPHYPKKYPFGFKLITPFLLILLPLPGELLNSTINSFSTTTTPPFSLFSFSPPMLVFQNFTHLMSLLPELRDYFQILSALFPFTTGVEFLFQAPPSLNRVHCMIVVIFHPSQVPNCGCRSHSFSFLFI